jgi:hypothetical protein
VQQPLHGVTTLASHHQEIARIRGQAGQHRTRVPFRRFDRDGEIARDSPGSGAESAPDQFRGRLAPLSSPEDKYQEMVAVAAMAPAAVLRQAKGPGPDGHQRSLM